MGAGTCLQKRMRMRALQQQQLQGESWRVWQRQLLEVCAWGCWKVWSWQPLCA